MITKTNVYIYILRGNTKPLKIIFRVFIVLF